MHCDFKQNALSHLLMEKQHKDLRLRVIGSQYFLYFGVLGIFLPYFNLYCYHLGFSGFEIGTLSALRTATTVLFPLLWGTLADRFRIRRPIYICCSFISTGVWALYLHYTDFWGMLYITVLYGLFYAPIISFLEAFTMDALESEKQQYGKIRVWGSISFIMTVMVVGKIIDLYAIKLILVLILAGSFLHAATAIKIPDLSIEKSASERLWTAILSKPRVIVFLFCAFLMLVSHGTYYGFFSIHLENLGYGKTFIGICWALASISEIAVMINSEKIFNRFQMEHVLVFSFVVAAVRWALLFIVTSPVLILTAQISHAVTYGMFHVASILYIDRLTPREAKTLGQAVNNAVTYGLGIMVGFFFNGYFYEKAGTFCLFLFSSAIALAGGLILAGYGTMAGSGRKAKGQAIEACCCLSKITSLD